jgi:GNAT superfamily N-acetyltransferase
MDTPATIRRLGSCERDSIRDHLLRLDDEDRRLRFGGPASAARIIAHCAGLDLGRAVGLGYLVAGEARGIAELRPIPGTSPRAAEAAISVERAFQGRGIGGVLLQRLTIAARNRWIGRLHMLCLLDNGRMVRLARRLDSRLSFDQGQIEASLALPWPTGWTVLQEIGGEAGAWWATPPEGAWPACGARSHRAHACAGGPRAA